MGNDVFLSLDPRSDLALSVALDIAEELQKNDICVIMPENISLREQIDSIRQCKVMVLLYTKEANTNEKILSDIDFAFAASKPIIPYMIDSTPINEELRYYLSRKHFLIAYPDWRVRLPELINAINILSGKVSDVQSRMANLKIIADEDCKLYIDGEYRGTLTQSRPFIITLARGKYDIRLESCETRFFEVTYPAFYFLAQDTVLYPKFEPVRRQEIEKSEERYIHYRSQYTFVESFDGMTRLFNSEGPFMVLNKYYFPISEKPFENAVRYHKGICAVKRDGYWGAVDKDGNVIVPFEYSGDGGYWPQVSGNKIIVTSGNRRGVLRMDGSKLTECKYSDVQPGLRGNTGIITSMSYESQYGFCNEAGKEVIENVHDSIKYTANEINLLVDQNSIYDFDGNCLYRTDKFKVHNADSTYAVIEKDGKFGYARMYDGEIVIEPRYDFAFPFSEMLAAVVIGEDLGFIDARNHFVIEPIYAFREKYIVQDLNGTPKYNYFRNGRAQVNSKKGGIIELEHPDKSFQKKR